MFSDPSQNVAAFGLTEGMCVADFGAGSGAYALAMSLRVGYTGKIYAVDVQKDLLERLAKLAKDKGRCNIEVIWGDAERPGGSKLTNGTVDVVLIADLLFQSEARYTLALEAKRVLRPEGQVIVIDWLDSFGNLGPAPAQVVKPETAKKIFTEAGFAFQSDFPAGDHHYGLIFTKAK